MDQGQVPVMIIWAVVRHIRILLTVRAGMDEGFGGAKLASLAGVPPYFIESYCDQARKWSVKKLEEMLLVLNETDRALKSTTGASSHIWLENLVLKSCSL
jgi:DNA polymerase-3 subunit delta